MRRKAHLWSHAFGEHAFTDCGVIDELHFPYVEMLRPEQLVWVPIEYQCRVCHKTLAQHYPGHGDTPDYVTSDTHSATPLMLTTVETIVLALERLGSA